MATLSTQTKDAPPSAASDNGESHISKSHALADDFPPAEPKKRRGRPPGPGKAMANAKAATVASPSVVDPATAQLNAQLVAATMTALIRGIDSVAQNTAAKYARAIGMAESQIDECTESLACSKEELDLINQATAAIAEKYGALGQYAPEMMLVVVLTSHGCRSLYTIGKLKGELRRIMDEKKKHEKT